MDRKTIDMIVWWIPFRRLRDVVRCTLNDIHSILNETIDTKNKINKILSKENIIYPCKLSDIDFYFYDSMISCTTDVVKKEIGPYNFDSIDFKEGDIVIDIGANIGMVSIYLAKKYPFLKIYAFEPVKQNYENLLKNIEINNIPKYTITAENVAITKDRRDIDIIIPLYNTAASSFVIERGTTALTSNIDIHVQSITFDDIFKKYNINKCKLLKIDCEGAEYEILYNASKENLKKCENMRREFHGCIDEEKQLYEYCSKYIKNIE